MNKADQQDKMFQEVLEGLTRPRKSLPSKFFYDEQGSKLFDAITELEEYYPTRTERKILEDRVHEIGAYLGEQVILIEPGSGSSDKTRILLEHLSNINAYIPIDISGEYLEEVGSQLQQSFPDVEVVPLIADYTHPFTLPKLHSSGRKVVFFPGSTIGNFDRDTVDRFLEIVADIAGPDGAFLIGVDLKKDEELLIAAYNDRKQITAAFNKNILSHINRELDTQFDPDKFSHRAIWNREDGRIEMYLDCLTDHTVSLGDIEISFKKGESIHTENSHKYTLREFEEIVSPWFEVKKVWTDPNDWFSLQYLALR